MKQTTVTTFEDRPALSWDRRVLISFNWRAILAGTILSIVFYVLLLSLGAGLAAVSLDTNDMQAADYGSIGIATGIWVFVAAAIALFVASFMAEKGSEVRTRRMGASQGAVIAAIFFLVVLVQAGSLLGSAGRFVSGVMTGTVGAVSQAASIPGVRDSIERSMNGLQLKSPPEEVAKNLGMRLIQRDVDGAVAYLGRETGLPANQLREKIGAAQTEINVTLDKIRKQAASTLATAGFSLFGLILVGLLSGIFGGYVAGRDEILES